MSAEKETVKAIVDELIANNEIQFDEIEVADEAIEQAIIRVINDDSNGVAAKIAALVKVPTKVMTTGTVKVGKGK
jgi:hypothetical protein